MMQSATQKVRKRSKTPIAGFAAAGAAPAAVAVSGLYGLFLPAPPNRRYPCHNAYPADTVQMSTMPARKM